MSSKRVYPRIPFAQRITGEGQSFFFSDFATDISLEGIGICSIRPLHTHQKIRLKFSLPGSTDVFEVPGRVVWDAREEGNERLGRRSGIKFSRLRQEDRDRLDSYIVSFLQESVD